MIGYFSVLSCTGFSQIFNYALQNVHCKKSQKIWHNVLYEYGIRIFFPLVLFVIFTQMFLLGVGLL